MSILASGVEYGAASARQTAERAVHLRQHGVTSDFTEKRMTTFETFKDGPAREILSRIGVDLDACLGWADFRSRFVEQNREMRDKNPDDSLASRARDLDGILSTGERSVLHAALAAADFADIADELWNWEVIDRLDPSHREAVAAAILREDAV
ncbi:hypothetical protein [Roseibium polysiphoniae]|uniref:Uncharacterized protein n=1 Tax=Roseibium polysiphoniae TaxID=2571221 RepID=A0ABR9CCR2_9HYPH|nr:hypothetical protein [Roseibium polysiphoniae]MBD8877674.1 hypothetical protein [Roseibium polysiphoniae]